MHSYIVIIICTHIFGYAQTNSANTCTQAHTGTHTHTCTHAHTASHRHSHMHTRTHSITQALTHTHTHTHNTQEEFIARGKDWSDKYHKKKPKETLWSHYLFSVSLSTLSHDLKKYLLGCNLYCVIDSDS